MDGRTNGRTDAASLTDPDVMTIDRGGCGGCGGCGGGIEVVVADFKSKSHNKTSHRRERPNFEESDFFLSIEYIIYETF